MKPVHEHRADLWNFASNIGLEKAINETNFIACSEDEKWTLALDPNNEADKCEIELKRTIPFRWGRIDCVSEESKKWTPYPFEATKTEKHSNPFNTGTAIIKELKEDFNFTARETISLMSAHGLGRHTQNFEQFLKYKWIGGKHTDPPPFKLQKRGIFHRLYFKVLNGKSYLMSGQQSLMRPGTLL